MQTHIHFAKLDDLFSRALSEDRNFLWEFEVYEFIRHTGGETIPHYFFLAANERIDEKRLGMLPGDTIVVKVVSPCIMHKSDVGGVRIIPKTERDLLSTVRRMTHEVPAQLAEQLARQPEMTPQEYRDITGDELQRRIRKDVHGYIICQFMQPDSEQFGNELLVSLRNTREFGMILSAGLGGRDTELFASRFRKGQAVVSTAVEQVDGQAFFELFRQTISYRKLAGLTRGGQRIVTDDQLLECFSALIEIGRYFGPTSTQTPYTIEELEINPFAFSDFLMMPLDGLCRFSTVKADAGKRPHDKIDYLLHPDSIGIVGISARKVNPGRIILDNILACGFPRQQLVLIHPHSEEIAGIRTHRNLEQLDKPVDLMILAVDGSQVPPVIDTILTRQLAQSVILISGNIGEQQDDHQLIEQIRTQILAERRNSAGAPVFIGANSLGIYSLPGHYDAMFIPGNKLERKTSGEHRGIALVSQSGAYMITKMSKLSYLAPAYAISIGNQIDLTSSDFLQFLNTQPHVRCLAFYVEGFSDLDGLRCAAAIRQAIPAGKAVIFYKAGRTPEGKNALSGHTASIAGDYMVCESCISQAGAMIADTFKEFEGLLCLAAFLQNKKIGGNRLAAVSNAGYEAVGIADNILGEGYRLELAGLSSRCYSQLQRILAANDLTSLATINNPVDITPMASEVVYTQVIGALLNDPNNDAVIAAIVPLTPMLPTLPENFIPADRPDGNSQLAENIGKLADQSEKPLIIVIDSGRLYDPLAEAFIQLELPVFRSADIAVRVLGKYMQNRLGNILSTASRNSSDREH